MTLESDNLLAKLNSLESENRDLQTRLDQALAELQALRSNGSTTGAQAESNGFRARRIEDDLHDVNRRLKLGYHNDQAWVYAEDEASYLKELCRVIVEDCGYTMVWIGMALDDPGKTIQPVAFAGFDEGYIQELHITWNDTAHGRGPTGTAVRTRKPVICHNFATDPALKPWRAEALKRGYASSLAVPLVSEGRAFGVITIYSQQSDPFIPEEVELISRLADDAAWGIQTIRLRDAHNRIENALLFSEMRFHSLFDQMTEGFILFEIISDDQGDPVDFHFLEVNSAFEHMTNLKREQVVGRRATEVFPGADRGWMKNLAQAAITGKPSPLETYIPSLGRIFDIYAYSPAPSQFALLYVDITDRKLVEGELAQSEQKFRTLFETMTQGIVYQDVNGRIIAANPAAERITGRTLAEMQGLTSADPTWRSIREDGTEFPGEEHPIYLALTTGKVVRDVIVGTWNPRDHTHHWLKVDAIPQFRPGETTPYQVYAIFDDITPRREIEATIRQINEGLIRLNHLLFIMSATRNMDLILETALEAVKDLWPGMESCRIWLWDEQNPSWLVCRAALGAERDVPAINLEAGPENFPEWLSSEEVQALVFREPLHKENPASPGSTISISNAIMVIPLRSVEKVRGIVEFRAKTAAEINQYERIILENLASFVAIAIENVFIYNQSGQAAVLAERSRLARDLHDSVSQALFSASMIAEALPRLWEQKPGLVKEGLDQLVLLSHGALAEMRSLLLELRPTALLDIDLCDLLRMLVTATLGRTDVKIDLSLSETCAPTQNVKIALYRIAQEAMNNIVKHSDAKHIQVSLTSENGCIELFIKDDGCGFDRSRITQGHMGLEIMRERAEKSGIVLWVESSPGNGTEVTANWPGGIEQIGEKAK